MEVNGIFYTMTELEKIVSLYQKNNHHFIGNKDIEYLVFLPMSLDELRELIQVNKYLKSLINTDEFWCQYLHQHYDVSYKTECLHIGNTLLKSDDMNQLFNKMIKSKDIAVIKFLLDTKQIVINYENLLGVTYLPLIKLLITYIDEEGYSFYKKRTDIKELVKTKNINVINQLLDNDRIPIDTIKELLYIYEDGIIHNALKKYYNTKKSEKLFSYVTSDSSDSDNDYQLSVRGQSPVHVRNKSPVRKTTKKSPVKKTARNKSPAKK